MMAGYRFNKEEYFKETKEVYSNYPTDVSRMEEELDRLQKENPKASSFQKKTATARHWMLANEAIPRFCR